MSVIPFERPLTPVQRARAAHAKQQKIAEKRVEYFSARYRGLLDDDEVAALANVGLIEAARSFDESLGSFESYCRCRVDWAILDGVRAEAPHARVSRTARKAAAGLLAFYRDDFNVLTHSQDEVKHRLAKLSDDVLAAAFLGMADELKRGSGGEEEPIDREEYAHAMETLAAATAQLRPKQRRLLQLVYEEKHTFTEIQGILGLGYNTVRRHHDALLADLRKALVSRGVTWAIPPPARAPWRGIAQGSDDGGDEGR